VIAQEAWVSASLKGGLQVANASSASRECGYASSARSLRRQAIVTHYRLGYHEHGNDQFAPRGWALQVWSGSLSWGVDTRHY
jgi:hypothetical protein